MQSATDTRLLAIAEPALPPWCDRFLARPGTGDFFAGRVWYDTLLAHALPATARPCLALCGPEETMLLPLLRDAGRLRSLTTAYSLGWWPLCAPGADADALLAAGQSFGRLRRGQAPARFDCLDPAAAGMEAFRDGLEAAGMVLSGFDHFGNWRQALAPGADWAAYLQARAPALRNTVARKLSRAARETRFTLTTEPGPALEAGIAAYHAVRDRSWKPEEPFPNFDAALMRAAAAIGALRLGVLRLRDGNQEGRAVAAQYWVVSGGCATLLKLSHVEDQRGASPGTVLTALMIQGLIAGGGVTALDFGRGDDAYKQLWVSERRQRIGLVVADPRHPAGLAELAWQAAGHGRRRVLGWLRQSGRIKPGRPWA